MLVRLGDRRGGAEAGRARPLRSGILASLRPRPCAPSRRPRRPCRPAGGGPDHARPLRHAAGPGHLDGADARADRHRARRRRGRGHGRLPRARARGRRRRPDARHLHAGPDRQPHAPDRREPPRRLHRRLPPDRRRPRAPGRPVRALDADGRLHDRPRRGRRRGGGLRAARRHQPWRRRGAAHVRGRQEPVHLRRPRRPHQLVPRGHRGRAGRGAGRRGRRRRGRPRRPHRDPPRLGPDQVHRDRRRAVAAGRRLGRALFRGRDAGHHRDRKRARADRRGARARRRGHATRDPGRRLVHRARHLHVRRDDGADARARRLPRPHDHRRQVRR